jgi:hypothetical protein
LGQERDEREAQKAENAEQSNVDFCTYALSYEKGSSELIIDGEVVGNVSRCVNLLLRLRCCSSELWVAERRSTLCESSPALPDFSTTPAAAT